ncbi:Dethiobiotin synthetase [hydrothermal vent metagenome]|uniref:Dethiobiotin synthetase n=1 Tax=hydrothermal vent metagenome TaxID=652676 RepID=A0A3B1BLK1_9ZZZZ
MKNQRGLFITGTDTEVGKTVVSVALLTMLKRQGLSTAAMKPVASGAVKTNDQFINDDALQLQQAASINASYAQVNPYVFPEAIAPHIAAAQAGLEIDFAIIKQAFQHLAENSDFILVEGVGGWLAPLNRQQTVADLALALELPVLLVVGLRLGCINHALLSARAIEQSGATLLGWIANKVQGDYPCVDDNIEAISQRLNVPLLATLDHCHDAASLMLDIRLEL